MSGEFKFQGWRRATLKIKIETFCKLPDYGCQQQKKNKLQGRLFINYRNSNVGNSVYNVLFLK
jgi:hypothetical protein